MSLVRVLCVIAIAFCVACSQPRPAKTSVDAKPKKSTKRALVLVEEKNEVPSRGEPGVDTSTPTIMRKVVGP